MAARLLNGGGASGMRGKVIQGLLAKATQASPLSTYIPPGNCVFGADWSPATLVSSETASLNYRICVFELADATKPLGLSTCACLLIKGGFDNEGNLSIRPYTPISRSHEIGQFTLAIRVYPGSTGVSSFLAQLPVGSKVDFKHVPFNVKIQYPFGKKYLSIVCGGTT